MKNQKKKKFYVNDQSIEAVLKEMREAGYVPVKRIEKPVFKMEDGKTIVSHQEIMFEGKLINEQ